MLRGACIHAAKREARDGLEEEMKSYSTVIDSKIEAAIAVAVQLKLAISPQKATAPESSKIKKVEDGDV